MKNKEVILSGILMGISGIFARMAMIVAGHSYELQDFLFNPLLWVSWAFGLVGFGYLQLALYKHNVSFVGPVVSSIAITTPVILAVVVLNEPKRKTGKPAGTRFPQRPAGPRSDVAAPGRRPREACCTNSCMNMH
jgi:hypothetical protein